MSDNTQQQPSSGDAAIDMDKIGPRPSAETSQPRPHMGMGKETTCFFLFLFAFCKPNIY